MFPQYIDGVHIRQLEYLSGILYSLLFGVRMTLYGLSSSFCSKTDHIWMDTPP